MIEAREIIPVDAEILQHEKDKTIALSDKGLVGEITAFIRSDLLQSLGLLDEAEQKSVLTAGEHCQDNNSLAQGHYRPEMEKRQV